MLYLLLVVVFGSSSHKIWIFVSIGYSKFKACVCTISCTSVLTIIAVLLCMGIGLNIIYNSEGFINTWSIILMCSGSIASTNSNYCHKRIILSC